MSYNCDNVGKLSDSVCNLSPNSNVITTVLGILKFPTILISVGLFTSGAVLKSTISKGIEITWGMRTKILVINFMMQLLTVRRKPYAYDFDSRLAVILCWGSDPRSFILKRR